MKIRLRAALRLLDELAVWNRTYSLTAITEREAMIRTHLLDSFSGYPGSCTACAWLMLEPVRGFLVCRWRWCRHSANSL